MRLRTKLAVVLFVVALLLTGGVYAATDWVERQQVRATQESTDDGARQVAEQLDGTMVRHSDTVRYYALRFAADESTDDEALLRTVVRGNRFLRGGTLVDPNGTVVAHEGDLPRNDSYRTVGANVSDRPGDTGGLASTLIPAPGRPTCDVRGVYCRSRDGTR